MFVQDWHKSQIFDATLKIRSDTFIGWVSYISMIFTTRFETGSFAS